MMIDSTALFAHIDDYFLNPERLKRIELFSFYARNVEGWFKGELLYLFHSLEKSDNVGPWGSEVRIRADAKQRTDFRATLADGPLYLELKTLFQGIRAGQPVDLGIYFPRSADGVGITGDVIKLLRATDGNKVLLLFVHPRPPREKWLAMRESYFRRMAPIALVEDSDVSRNPESLYICKLNVKGGF
jgi:hypothetical protein